MQVNYSKRSWQDVYKFIIVKKLMYQQQKLPKVLLFSFYNTFIWTQIGMSKL